MQVFQVLSLQTIIYQESTGSLMGHVVVRTIIIISILFSVRKTIASNYGPLHKKAS